MTRAHDLPGSRPEKREALDGETSIFAGSKGYYSIEGVCRYIGVGRCTHRDVLIVWSLRLVREVIGLGRSTSLGTPCGSGNPYKAWTPGFSGFFFGNAVSENSE